ncbi:hypothetical protein [endosymbiont of Pachyrhynchus infernalis]|uniref:hypothetical protein n=1 Tax=endosymbiont of Pachyrhynchus infernalis TaxID=1971488 RepID=UPI000DC6EB5D|nr:hypothetical protein [endosymbiont of Pachyrhynchus infernalis]BBA84927.1 hypothetical protein NARPIN1_02110 [endosymbiont of Pachyrhynchus infernalis]
MEIININNLLNLVNFNKQIFFIILNDFFLTNKIKNILINKIYKLENNNNIYIKNYYVNNNSDLFNILYINNNLNIFNKKIIIIINLENLFFFNEKIFNFLNIKNIDIIIIFILNNNYYNININIFLNNFKKTNIYFIKENHISYNTFIFLIKNIFIKKYKFNLISKKTYNLLYLMYENNFIDINKILNYLCINNKKILNNNDVNKLSKIYFINPNYNSWIFLSIFGYKELSNLNILIIKNSKNNDSFINILKSLKKNLLFIISNSFKKENKNYLFINNLDVKYKNIILKNINKLNKNVLYKIIKLMFEIDLFVKNSNYKDEEIIWNKLDLISLLLNNLIYYEKNIK